MRYDHPNAIVLREESIEGIVGAAGVNARFARVQAIRLISVTQIVITAGTATNNACVVKNGTNVLGTQVTGTQAAGAVITTPINADIPAGGVLTVTNGADTLFKSLIIYQYQAAAS